METKMKKISEFKEIFVPMEEDGQHWAIDNQWAKEHFNEEDSTGGICIYRVSNSEGSVIMISNNGSFRELDVESNDIEQIGDFNNGYCEISKNGERLLFTLASEKFIPLEFKPLLDSVYIDPLKVQDISREKLFYDLETFLCVASISLNNSFYALKTDKDSSIAAAFLNLAKLTMLSETDRKFKALVSSLQSECEQYMKEHPEPKDDNYKKWWRDKEERDQIVEKLSNDKVTDAEIIAAKAESVTFSSIKTELGIDLGTNPAQEKADKMLEDYLKQHKNYCVLEEDIFLLEEASKTYMEIMYYNSNFERVISEEQITFFSSKGVEFSPKNLNSYAKRVAKLTKTLEKFGLKDKQDFEEFLPVIKAKGLANIGEFSDLIQPINKDTLDDINTFFEEFRQGGINKTTKIDNELELL